MCDPSDRAITEAEYISGLAQLYAGNKTEVARARCAAAPARPSGVRLPLRVSAEWLLSTEGVYSRDMGRGNSREGGRGWGEGGGGEHPDPHALLPY